MRDLQVGRLLQTPSFLRITCILLALIFSSMAGVFGLVYPLPHFPLVVPGVVVAVVAGIVLLRHPIWTLYVALFLVLLPIGLIPNNVHSILNRAMTVAAWIVWLFDVLVRHRRVRWTASATFMLAFLAWSLVTLFWAPSLTHGTVMLQTYGLRFTLFLLLIPDEVRTGRTLNGLMNTLALAGWVLITLGLGTMVIEGYVPGTRLSVLGMNENSLGVLALLTMVGVLWRAMQPSQRHRRLTILASGGFLLAMLALTAASGSRGSAISLAITLLSLCWWRPTRHWGMLGMLALALGAATAPFLFSTTLERFAGMPGDTMLGGREALWQATTKLFLDHPWGGVGIGNAPSAVMPYVRLLRSVLGQERAVAHSPLLTIAAETGIVGILLYVGILGSAVWSFAREWRQRQRSGSRVLEYFALVSSVFLGYMASWIKGGGMESDFSYFLMLALLLIPSPWNPKNWTRFERIA